jgi:Fe-S oxidoreductase
MNVQLFIPCFVDQLYPNTAFNMIKVLEKAGCTVSYNTSQTCCGQPAFNAGFWDEAKSMESCLRIHLCIMKWRTLEKESLNFLNSC